MCKGTGKLLRFNLLAPWLKYERESDHEKRKRYCFKSGVLCCALLFIFLSSCKGSDEPEVMGSAPVVVTLQLDTAMVDWQTIDDSRAIASHDLRCQVAAYPVNADGAIVDAAVDRQTVFFTADGQQGQCRMVLPSGSYRLLAWADWVEHGSVADKYYTTSDFNDITFIGKYEGNNDYRNAYSGSAAVSFKVKLGDTTTVVREQLPLRSIMGKVKFVATDYNDYLAKGQNLRILVAYSGFLPNRYSVPRGVPFDATTGINFISSISETSTEGDGTATLGWDYVMVNGEESSVTMALGLYNDEGQLVGQSATLNVPIKRGGITVVKDDFLTKTAGGGGIGIDPSFDGDINIYF